MLHIVIGNIISHISLFYMTSLPIYSKCYLKHYHYMLHIASHTIVISCYILLHVMLQIALSYMIQYTCSYTYHTYTLCDKSHYKCHVACYISVSYVICYNDTAFYVTLYDGLPSHIVLIEVMKLLYIYTLHSCKVCNTLSKILLCIRLCML